MTLTAPPVVSLLRPWTPVLALGILLAGCSGGDSPSDPSITTISFSDPAGDATAASGVANSPDILDVLARLEAGALEVDVTIAHYDPDHTEILVALDTDLNSSTGFVQLDGLYGYMGADYTIEFGPVSPSDGVRLTRCAPGCFVQPDAATWSVDTSAGILSVHIPLADLGSSDGRMELRVGTAHVYSGPTVSSPTLDVAPEGTEEPARIG